MSQVDLEELREQIRQLTTRVSRLETTLPQVSRLEETLTPPQSPPQEAAPPMLPQEPGLLSSVPDTPVVLRVLGGGFLGLAGAYLLRAVAESGVLPSRLTFTIAVLYAVAWLLWAARARLEHRLAAILYSLTSVMILAPLLWESTLRFGMITTGEASVILVAFTLIGLAVSWRRNLLAVATISTLAGLGTTAALLVATHDVLPFTFVFLAIAAAVEACACLNHWLGERWLAAAAADLSVLLATWLVTNPRGLPEVYAPIPTRYLFAAQMALVLIYLSSVMVRTLLRGLTFTGFETAQCALAFVVGVGGALRLSAGDLHLSPAIAGFVLVCGATCYAISFVVLERHGSHGRNFFTYSTFGFLLVFVGCRILLSGVWIGIVWSVLAVLCTGAGGRWAKPTLGVHGGIYLVLALMHSGALRQSAGFLLGTDLWPGAAPVALWTGAAVAAACYLLARRSVPAIGAGWNFRALRLGIAAVLTWETLGLAAGGLTGLLHGVSGLAPGDPYCATLRTGAVVVAALLLATLSSRPHFHDLAQMVYPLMILGAYRLLAVDMRQDRKVSLFLSLLLYGAALMLIPRFRRAHSILDPQTSRS